MNDVRIISMHEHHVDDVVAIEMNTSATPWSAATFISEINSPTHILLVAIVDSDIHPHAEKALGFTGGQLVGDELHIHSLSVSPEHRREGIGRSLVRELIRSSIERGATSSTLEVRTSNEPAISLYKSLGFFTEGMRPKYYIDNGEDASIMWLRTFEGFTS